MEAVDVEQQLVRVEEDAVRRLRKRRGNLTRSVNTPQLQKTRVLRNGLCRAVNERERKVKENMVVDS